MAESEIVTVERDGKTRKFTVRQWDIMGSDKYGWEVVPSTPKEVAMPALQAPQPITADKGRKSKKR